MTRSAEPLVIFSPSGRRGHVPEGTTVLDAARSGAVTGAVAGSSFHCENRPYSTATVASI